MRERSPGEASPSDKPAALREQIAMLTARLALFEHVLANIPDVIARFDRQLRHSYVSPAIERVTGMAPEAFLGKTNAELGMPANLVAEWDAALEEVFTTGQERSITFHFPGVGGDYYYEARLAPEIGPTGAVESVLSVSRDVTTQVQAVAALRDREAFFRHTFDASPLGAAILDTDGRFLRVNTALCRLTGYAAEELRSRGVPDITHPDDLGADQERRRQLVAGEIEQYELDARYLHRDGHAIWVHLSVGLVRDESGQPRYILPIIEDITGRRRAEEERQQLERALQEAQRLESIGVLAGGIAHDFNNLWAIVLGNTELALVDLPADSPTRRSLDQIVVAAQRATELTRQLLIYAGKRRSDVRPLRLNDLIRDNALLLEASVAKDVALRYELAHALPDVLADETQIRQVLLNLVINASEAIGAAGGPITLTTALRHMTAEDLARCRLGVTEPAGDYVALTVRDTGSGMDAATLEQIFDPFFTTKVSGRGLGLAVVRGIVGTHRGALQVTSSAGHGSAFTLLLPALPQRSGLRAAPLAAPWSGAGTVLVVDDEVGVRLVASRMLEQLRYTTRLAGGGLAALEILRAEAGAIGCVLLDLTMPQLDGVQTLHMLRQIAPSMPVILMSGYNVDDTAQEVAGLQMVDVLQKPFTLDALRTALRRVVPTDQDTAG